MTFQYYPNQIKSNAPIGVIGFNRFFESIRSPKKQTVEIYEAIEQAEINKDEAKKAELKSKLYYFTPAVFVRNFRRYDNIMHWTGLMPFDFDHIQNAPEFRDYLIDSHPYILAAWLSSSKKGVRGFVKIPQVTSTDDYKALFYGLSGALSIYPGFDKAPQNCVLPLFMSYDPEAKLNNDAITWSAKGFKRSAFDYHGSINSYMRVTPNSRDEETVEKICKSAIDKIHTNGHPQLRGIAIALGGYVGAGYLTDHAAENLIEGLIHGNAYLSQKPHTYIRTAKQMIQFGQSKPTYLNE